MKRDIIPRDNTLISSLLQAGNIVFQCVLNNEIYTFITCFDKSVVTPFSLLDKRSQGLILELGYPLVQFYGPSLLPGSESRAATITENRKDFYFQLSFSSGAETFLSVIDVNTTDMKCVSK